MRNNLTERRYIPFIDGGEVLLEGKPEHLDRILALIKLGEDRKWASAFDNLQMRVDAAKLHGGTADGPD